MQVGSHDFLVSYQGEPESVNGLCRQFMKNSISFQAEVVRNDVPDLEIIRDCWQNQQATAGRPEMLQCSYGAQGR